MKLERKERLAWNVGGVVLFITIWEGFGQWLGSRIISPPSLVAIDYVQLLEEGVMLRELLFSLRQMLVGFGLACALGMPLGVLMGRYKTVARSEEHTSELQSLMRISYAVFCLKKKSTHSQ